MVVGADRHPLLGLQSGDPHLERGISQRKRRLQLQANTGGIAATGCNRGKK
jgi:hypothetical protein